ncbi:MAG: hypothetical protein ACP5QN_02270 [Minisyncoccia bacterium]
MKNYAKTGNQLGRPAYRTSKVFIYKKYFQIKKVKSTNKNLLKFKKLK